MRAYFLGFNFKDSIEVKMRSAEIRKISALSQLKRIGEEKVLCINGASDSSIDRARVGFIVQEAKDAKTHVVVVRDDKDHFKEFEREMAFIDGPSLKSSEIVANFVSMVRSSMQKFVGESREIMELKSKIFNACFSDRNFFITGESGSGKHLLAEVVHGAGLRSGGPFILFRDEYDLKTTLSDLDGGHLFIEELNSISQGNQKTICDFFGKRNPDLRIISSTRNTEKDYGFTCLNEVVLKIPPLRDRKSDVPVLTDYFIKIASYDCHFEELPFEMQDRLLGYSYPGNVRELRDIINDYLFNDHSEKIFQNIFISNFISSIIFEIMDKSKSTTLDGLKAEISKWFSDNYVKGLLKNFKWDEDKFSNIFEYFVNNLKILIEKRGISKFNF
ncbi:MAG: sigma 54-interacting transcriptional regulator [Athalassotoga sp.]|uniref:sigma 54-interacting transcriptional regulator n=1 Tax=Athalassotoga sp. TaxID=2022597 RepID=UPI003CFFDEAA